MALPCPQGCPDCESEDLRYIGRGLSFGNFGGQRLVEARKSPCDIYECRHCHLTFKYPRIEQIQALALYNESSGDVWSSDIPRPEFEVAERIARDLYPGHARVLDVGCNGGEFLARLPQDTMKFGVEVNRTAAERARRGGVLTWNDVCDISPGHLFDVVTCFDVIEHIHAPSKFLRQLLALLKPGGRLVLSSGDTVAFFSQPRPSLNWYFANPEHVSFISEAWLVGALSDLDSFQVDSIKKFLHGRTLRGAIPAIKIALFKLAPYLYLATHKSLKRALVGSGGLFVPGNGFMIDHICVVVKRIDEN